MLTAAGITHPLQTSAVDSSEGESEGSEEGGSEGNDSGTDAGTSAGAGMGQTGDGRDPSDCASLISPQLERCEAKQK